MFDWLFVGIDRYGRPDPAGLARRLNHVPRWVVRRIAQAKLRKTLRHVWRNSHAQRERWQEAGVRYRDLGNPKVMRRIPFCDKKLLVTDPGAFYCVPEEELIHVITTSGTTGRAKKLYFTKDDLERQTRMIGTNLRRLPGASRVLAIYRTMDPTWAAGAFVRRAIEEAGMFGLLTGNQMPPEENIRLIRDYRIDVLMSSASCLHRLTVEAKENLRELGVRYIILATQAWTEDLRKELSEAWGARVLDAYGANEFGCGIASECLEQNGLHVSEVDFWLEVVDPETGEEVEPGEEGELVITTLSRRGMPLVRYRIGDLARVLPMEGRCRCGLAVHKISRIRGRTDDMLILATGANVFPDEIDESVLSIAGVTDYQLVIEREGYLDVLHLTVETEMTGDELRKVMTEAMKQVNYVRMGIEESRTVKLGRVDNVPRGTLTKDRPKSQRIIDKRVVTD